MFEEELKSMKQKIISFSGGRERVPLSEILNWEIPRAVKDYFNILAERIISEEVLSVLLSKRFNQDDIFFVETRKNLLRSLKGALMLYQKEFEDAVDKASRFAINFVLRPEWTLARVVFKKDDTRTKEQILETIANFSEYEYYRKLVEQVLQKYQQDEIKVDFFKKLLRKLDEEVFKNLSVSEILNLAKPIFELFKFATNSDFIPADALIIFFGDKGREDIVREVENERDLHMKSKFSVRDFEIVLKRFVKEEKKFEPAVETLSEAGEKLPETTAEVEFEEEVKANEEQKTVALPDLNSFIDEKRREKFIKKIFKHNVERYEEAIRKLNTIDNWKDASAFVDSIFIEFEIDPYSDEAVEFTDTVYRRYFRGMR